MLVFHPASLFPQVVMSEMESCFVSFLTYLLEQKQLSFDTFCAAFNVSCVYVHVQCIYCMMIIISFSGYMYMYQVWWCMKSIIPPLVVFYMYLSLSLSLSLSIHNCTVMCPSLNYTLIYKLYTCKLHVHVGGGWVSVARQPHTQEATGGYCGGPVCSAGLSSHWESNCEHWMCYILYIHVLHSTCVMVAHVIVTSYTLCNLCGACVYRNLSTLSLSFVQLLLIRLLTVRVNSESTSKGPSYVNFGHRHLWLNQLPPYQSEWWDKSTCVQRSFD